VYIDWGLKANPGWIEKTRRCADYLGWEFEIVRGDPGYLRRLLDGDWDRESFAVVQAGQEITEERIAITDTEGRPCRN
jgi:hypothetical protein